MGKTTVFISHISQEAALASILKKHIVKDFLDLVEVFVSSDATSISVGSDWLKSVDSALHSACIELVLCSKSSVNRPWINFEAGAGWIKGIPIVPVCHSGMRPSELPMPLTVLQAVEASREKDLYKIYSLISSKLGSAEPRVDFNRIAEEVRSFEAGYSIQIEKHLSQTVEQLDSQWGMIIGNLKIPWVVAGYGPYHYENIESYYHPNEPTYPDDVEDIFRPLCRGIEQREKKGEDVPFDSDDYKLIRFHVSSRTRHLEEPKLILHFAPTTYFRMLATDQYLDVPINSGGRTYTLRERYATKIDLRMKPVPEFATHWGVGLGVITCDNYLLISERGNTAVDPNIFFPSVAEGGSRAKDSAAGGAPDHFSIAKRGMDEELGANLLSSELTWLSFGANSVLCEYALIGRVNSKLTYEEIRQRRSVGSPIDKWESIQIHAVPFDSKSVVQFCADPNRRFSPFALVTFVHCLINEFGLADVETAFKDVNIKVTQKLPHWIESET